MKVRVFAPSYCSFALVDDDNYMELKEGATLQEVLRNLKIPVHLRPITICMVNYQKVKKHTVLKEGDVISFLAPLVGG